MFQLKFTIVYNSLSVFALFCLHDCSVAIMLPLSYHAESTWTCTIICDCTDCTVFVKKQTRCSGIFNNPETSPKHTYDSHTHTHWRYERLKEKNGWMFENALRRPKYVIEKTGWMFENVLRRPKYVIESPEYRFETTQCNSLINS